MSGQWYQWTGHDFSPEMMGFLRQQPDLIWWAEQELTGGATLALSYELSNEYPVRVPRVGGCTSTATTSARLSGVRWSGPDRRSCAARRRTMCSTRPRGATRGVTGRPQMSELMWNLLAVPVPLLLVAALALGLSRIPGRSLAEASNWGAVTIIAGVIGLAAWVMVVWKLEDKAIRPPAAPPVVLELRSPLGGELAACAASGGVQMVYADGAWTCVPAEQAG